MQLPNDIDRGKALFLDTMGFADTHTMGGDITTLQTAINSYQNKLLPRHFVLAKLAREGLCSTLLTTNYDLLLEGAYRISGFELTPQYTDTLDTISTLGNNSAHTLPDTPQATYNHLAVIAGADDFFNSGHGYRSALIVKIHGCANRYRKYRQSISAAKDSTTDFQNYLTAMVFTYREIQHWREDSWSRDFWCTLLRTHTVTFSGYSVQDPVLHDTIRNVYEDMAQKHHKLADTRTTAEVPAYFMGVGKQADFYGMEILRAASAAVGQSAPCLLQHNNYLPFCLRAWPPATAVFPTLDDQMQWLFHITFRKRQQTLFGAHILRIATMLLQRNVPRSEITQLYQDFDTLLNSENQAAENWCYEVATPRDFTAIINWSRYFHHGLLRELVLAETVQQAGEFGKSLKDLRQTAVYYPMLDHAEWAAWGVIIELALRKAISHWQGAAHWHGTSEWLKVAANTANNTVGTPQLHFAKGADMPALHSLTIQMAVFERQKPRQHRPGYFSQQQHWYISAKSLPWAKDNNEKLPPAKTLWRWALGRFNQDEDFNYLGVSNGHH